MTVRTLSPIVRLPLRGICIGGMWPSVLAFGVSPPSVAHRFDPGLRARTSKAWQSGRGPGRPRRGISPHRSVVDAAGRVAIQVLAPPLARGQVAVPTVAPTERLIPRAEVALAEQRGLADHVPEARVVAEPLSKPRLPRCAEHRTMRIVQSRAGGGIDPAGCMVATAAGLFILVLARVEQQQLRKPAEARLHVDCAGPRRHPNLAVNGSAPTLATACVHRTPDMQLPVMHRNRQDR